jgi:folate-binding protein YgfZ
MSEPPDDFGDWRSEYVALTEGVGLVDLADRSQVELTGRDRATFLHNLCTNDIKRLSPGGGCEAFLCNVQGKSIGHGLVFCGPESLVLETVPGQGGRLVAHLDRYLIREQVELHDRSAEWAELLLAGPEAEPLLAGMGVVIPPGRLAHAAATFGGHPVSVRRVEFTVPGGILLSVPRAAMADVRQILTAAGATVCGRRAFEAARIEAGWPSFGQDISDENLPQELARDQQAISFTKGCYLGQETVARIDALGHVNRTLCGIRFQGETPPAAGSELTAAGKTIGRITSATFSPRLSAPLALAYVRRGHNAPGAIVEAEVGQGEVVSLGV